MRNSQKFGVGTVKVHTAGLPGIVFNASREIIVDRSQWINNVDWYINILACKLHRLAVIASHYKDIV